MTHPKAPSNAGPQHAESAVAIALSKSGLARRDAILSDLLARAPAIRRARIARRAAICSSPLCLAMVAILAAHSAPTSRPLLTPTTSDSPTSSTSISSLDEAPPTERAIPLPPVQPIVQVVSTADRSYTDRIVSAGFSPRTASPLVVQFIDDDAMLNLLALEGRPDGIVRVGDRTLLASDLSSQGAMNPARPGAGGPSIPAPFELFGL